MRQQFFTDVQVQLPHEKADHIFQGRSPADPATPGSDLGRVGQPLANVRDPLPAVGAFAFFNQERNAEAVAPILADPLP